jgi:hypothetical protein
MSWIAHYFDPKLNTKATTRPDALRLARDLMRRQCRVEFIEGSGDLKIHAVEIAKWCKTHPTNDRRRL